MEVKKTTVTYLFWTILIPFNRVVTTIPEVSQLLPALPQYLNLYSYNLKMTILPLHKVMFQNFFPQHTSSNLRNTFQSTFHKIK